MPFSRAEMLEQVVRDLLEWEANMGGWEASVWDRAKEAIKRIDAVDSCPCGCERGDGYRA